MRGGKVEPALFPIVYRFLYFNYRGGGGRKHDVITDLRRLYLGREWTLYIFYDLGSAERLRTPCIYIYTNCIRASVVQSQYQDNDSVIGNRVADRTNKLRRIYEVNVFAYPRFTFAIRVEPRVVHAVVQRDHESRVY